MAYIQIEDENLLPGIRGLMAYSPETSAPMNILADVLLYREDRGTIGKADRELIAAYVSYLNDCYFCQNVHGAAASCYYDDGGKAFGEIKQNINNAQITSKLKSLLEIAASVQKGGKQVKKEQIELAKGLGCTDLDIHDTVLIAAAFCMFNRYVDGLNTWVPDDKEIYTRSGERIKSEGYAGYDPLKIKLSHHR